MFPNNNSSRYYGAAANYNKPHFKIGLIGIISLVLGVLILLVIGFFVVNLATSGPRTEAMKLIAREKNFLKFLTDNQKSITNEDLSVVNSSAVSLQTSDFYSLQKGIKNNYNVDEIPDEVFTAEADTTSKDKLATAKTKIEFDQVYVQIVHDKIASIQQLADTVNQNAGGSFKTAIDTNLANLKVVDQKMTQIKF